MAKPVVLPAEPLTGAKAAVLVVLSDAAGAFEEELGSLESEVSACPPPAELLLSREVLSTVAIPAAESAPVPDGFPAGASVSWASVLGSVTENASCPFCVAGPDSIGASVFAAAPATIPPPV